MHATRCTACSAEACSIHVALALSMRHRMPPLVDPHCFGVRAQVREEWNDAKVRFDRDSAEEIKRAREAQIVAAEQHKRQLMATRSTREASLTADARAQHTAQLDDYQRQLDALKEAQSDEIAVADESQAAEERAAAARQADERAALELSSGRMLAERREMQAARRAQEIAAHEGEVTMVEAAIVDEVAELDGRHVAEAEALQQLLDAEHAAMLEEQARQPPLACCLRSASLTTRPPPFKLDVPALDPS